MDEKERAVFEDISRTLKEIRDAMNAPKSRFQKTVDFLVSAVAISGLVFIIDQVIKWIKG
ncbi:MAG: hypothetical protein LBD22_05580 [Spirochaetaceae bacterium]|jgi:hypothetical protein|nr:hypothetical protein [Spirochaetaceae bacterium]